MEYLRIKNWRTYQHYSNRSPSWIKLHADALDDFEFRDLPDKCKGQLVCIWILASRLHDDLTTDAVVPADPTYLSALTGCGITMDSLQTIMNVGFLVPCQQDASDCLADASPRARGPAHSVSVSVSGCLSKKDAAEFDLFWDHYPRRVGKIDARKAWQQTAKIRPSIDELIVRLDELAISKDWLKDNGQYVPNPATWLRRGGWEDEVR